MPVKTKEMMRAANKFRKSLLNDGFQMMQLSVYTRIIRNDCNVNKHLNYIKNNLPPKGGVRVLTITEKQYSSMEILVGNKSRQEKIINHEQLLLL